MSEATFLHPLLRLSLSNIMEMLHSNNGKGGLVKKVRAALTVTELRDFKFFINKWHFELHKTAEWKLRANNIYMADNLVLPSLLSTSSISLHSVGRDSRCYSKTDCVEDDWFSSCQWQHLPWRVDIKAAIPVLYVFLFYFFCGSNSQNVISHYAIVILTQTWACCLHIITAKFV